MENGNDEKHVAVDLHLLVMVNGILGSVTDWKFAVRNPMHKLLVHSLQVVPPTWVCNTRDGVDVMDQRVDSTPSKHPKDFDCCTLRWRIGGKLCYWRTGRHLFLNDNDHGKPPLLRRLLQDVDEYYFMSALRAFKWRVIYSNVAYDNIVGWQTSSIRSNYELPKWEDSVSEKYPHVVHEELCKAYDVEQSAPVTTDDQDADKIEEDVINGLSGVSWEKIDVSFHTSKQRSDAHSIIQVKDVSRAFRRR